MSLLASVEELIENFEFLDDWEDRYRYLIDLGKSLEGLPQHLKTDENKVRGCTSQVWFTHHVQELEQDEQQTKSASIQVIFKADSDAYIVRGLVVILLSAYSQKTPEEILSIDIKSLFQRLGLERNLSFSRRNGFFSMVERIQQIASQLSTESMINGTD